MTARELQEAVSQLSGPLWAVFKAEHEALELVLLRDAASIVPKTLAETNERERDLARAAFIRDVLRDFPAVVKNQLKLQQEREAQTK